MGHQTPPLSLWWRMVAQCATNTILAGVRDYPGLTDDVDFDFAWVAELGFNRGGNRAGKGMGLKIVEGSWIHKNTDLATSRNGESFLHALKGGGDGFEISETLDVVFD